MLWRSRRKSRQEGQALVETAIMIPVVLLLLMGIIEFGFLFYAHVRVANATREGARAGSLWLMTTDGTTLQETVEMAVQDELAGFADPGDYVPDVVTDEDIADLEAGDAITVTVTYDYYWPVVSAIPVIRGAIPYPFPVSRRVVMRFQ